MTDSDLATLSFFFSSVCGFISLTIGFAGFAFGVYTHFSTRRVAKVTYTLTQLTDYDLPASIIASIRFIPFVIEIKSGGNKQIENARIRIITASDIEEIKVESAESHQEVRDTRKTQIAISSLNPGETVKVSGQCAKIDGIKNYIEKVEITHSEGSGERAT